MITLSKEREAELLAAYNARKDQLAAVEAERLKHKAEIDAYYRNLAAKKEKPHKLRKEAKTCEVCGGKN